MRNPPSCRPVARVCVRIAGRAAESRPRANWGIGLGDRNRDREICRVRVRQGGFALRVPAAVNGKCAQRRRFLEHGRPSTGGGGGRGAWALVGPKCKADQASQGPLRVRVGRRKPSTGTLTKRGMQRKQRSWRRRQIAHGLQGAGRRDGRWYASALTFFHRLKGCAAVVRTASATRRRWARRTAHHLRGRTGRRDRGAEPRSPWCRWRV